MIVANNKDEFTNARNKLQKGSQLALIPTMGALHAGHLSLIEAAKKKGFAICLSVFLNPLQFNNPEDLRNYPSNLEKDQNLAKLTGIDIFFSPSVEEIYPSKRPEIKIQAPAIAKDFCGKFRPGHFDGVCTVLAIFFNIVQPQAAVFGEKDFQQIKVVEKLVQALHLPIEIIHSPLIRDSDGIALSSRNKLLDQSQRQTAKNIFRVLIKAKNNARNNFMTAKDINDFGMEELQKKGIKVDYFSVVEESNLKSLDKSIYIKNTLSSLRILTACYVDQIRLIDNITINGCSL